ncbi:MAG: tetratricopeptide repeat protein [Bacteroidales bacterium]|jgi:tetratricopeptide (TPR) repeat protein|nr:tetratricopeptide repeat protein [Bacteroidales bacterium]
MAEESQNVGQLEQIGESVSKIEKFFEDNKKTITIVVVVVAVLICGFFAYKNLYLTKQQDKALAAMWQAQRAFDEDSFQIALYGNENVTGFVDVIDEYSNTKAGNTAYYYAGCCAMKLGEFEDAVKYLKKFSTDDPILEPLSIGLLGDAYCELNELDKAVSKYEKAAKVADDEYMSPMFLSKAGLVYEKLGKYSDAIKVYTKIKKEYDNSPQAASIDKYITRANLLKK